MSWLQRIQNRAVRMTCGLRKYDHVSQYRANLGWLPMSEFVKYRTILTMFGQHYLGEGILLQPPIDFGRKHSYRTRCSPWFADIFRFKKNFSQHFFWHQATVWWNSLPPNLFDDITNFHDVPT